MPAPALLTGWTQQTPPGFRFALKAPQQITHRLRLKNAAEPAHEFIRRSEALGTTRGPLLFQLPPNLKADLARLGVFLAALPGGIEPAFESYSSWSARICRSPWRASTLPLRVALPSTFSVASSLAMLI